jgi:hypothetical protein
MKSADYFNCISYSYDKIHFLLFKTHNPISFCCPNSAKLCKGLLYEACNNRAGNTGQLQEGKSYQNLILD